MLFTGAGAPGGWMGRLWWSQEPTLALARSPPLTCAGGAPRWSCSAGTWPGRSLQLQTSGEWQYRKMNVWPFTVFIRQETKGDVSVEKMDLASLASISACVDRLKKYVTKIDILINNAGVMMCPLTKTEDGFEMQIGTNHFGHFYLTNLLLPLVKKVMS